MGYEFAYVIGAFVLLAALGFGIWRNSKRNKRVDAITEAATKEQYEHPERYKRTQKLYEDAAKD